MPDPGAVVYSAHGGEAPPAPPARSWPVADYRVSPLATEFAERERAPAKRFAGAPLPARCRIPKDLLADPEAYFRTVYTNWPDEFSTP